MQLHVQYMQAHLKGAKRHTHGAVQGTPVEVVMLQPYKLSPGFFAERMRGVSADMSEDIFSRLQAIDVIDAAGYCQWEKCDVPYSCW